VDFLRSELQRIAPDNLLEVGSGSGRLRAVYPCPTVSVDISSEMMRRNRGHAQMTGTSLGFRDNTFDASMTSLVLIHTPHDDIGSFISELARVSNRSVLLFELSSIRSREPHLFQHDYPALLMNADLELIEEVQCPRSPRNVLYVADV